MLVYIHHDRWPKVAYRRMVTQFPVGTTSKGNNKYHCSHGLMMTLQSTELLTDFSLVRGLGISLKDLQKQCFLLGSAHCM